MISLAAVFLLSVAPEAVSSPAASELPQDLTTVGNVTPQLELDPRVWVQLGARVPSIELPRIDGKGTVDLADLRGRKLLLIQFASW